MLVVWQAMQLVAPTGMCVLFLPVAPLPLWHDEQFVATVKVLWSTFAPVQVVKDLWQVSQAVCPTCTVVLGFALAWQVLHCDATVTLACSLPLVQVVVLPLWHASQLAAEAPVINQ